MPSDGSGAPYHEVVRSLVRSIAIAQAEIVESVFVEGKGIDDFKDLDINRHFAWLALAYPPSGINRHFYDGFAGSQPLKTRALRAPTRLPDAIRTALEDHRSIPAVAEWPDPANAVAFVEKRLVQRGPTRISRLVREAVRETLYTEGPPATDPELWPELPDDDENVIYLKSPFAIAFDFLTVPEMPGSRAYAQLAIRNLIFESCGAFPRGLADLPSEETFSTADIERALSKVWTYFRPRFSSTGEDSVPPAGQAKADAVLRTYLAAKGLLWVRFASINELRRHTARWTIGEAAQGAGTRSTFEYARAEFLDKLPELGEVVNELWGIPIPIRGADTIFRGGLRLSTRRGLVLGVHGGPGTGKTSLALALGAYLAPFEISTLFVTAEEAREDLYQKTEALLPDQLRRLSFFPQDPSWLNIQPIPWDGSSSTGAQLLEALETSLDRLASTLRQSSDPPERRGAPKPCRAVIVLDGVHDLLMMAGPEGATGGETGSLLSHLRRFIVTCRELQALVVLTSGEDWAGDKTLDYLVDVAIRLTHRKIDDAPDGQKPYRQIVLTKARHQLCALGAHGFQIAGAKGVRFSPQINYELERQSVWRTRLPRTGLFNYAFQSITTLSWFLSFASKSDKKEWRIPAGIDFHRSERGALLFHGANIFINGEGSGGKAALALKIAFAPIFDTTKTRFIPSRILVISFLYPREYYINIAKKLRAIRQREYNLPLTRVPLVPEVIHLYPGYYKPEYLFNRVEWELNKAELQGAPYTSVVIDGMHNVFLQFPEIEDYRLFWPQLYAALRRRALTVISTHTMDLVQQGADREAFRFDDRRSEPLRHALAQKTDFRFEVEPARFDDHGHIRKAIDSAASDVFFVRPISVIDQALPKTAFVWNRENLVLADPEENRLL